MAKTVTTTTTVTISGDGFGGSPLFNWSVQNLTGSAPGSVALSNGFNSIAIPATAAGVVIVPPPTNGLGMTLKGITGDTGIPIDPANPTMLKFTVGAVASFGIQIAGALTIELIWL